MIKTYFKHKSYYKPEGLITNYNNSNKYLLLVYILFIACIKLMNYTAL